MSPPAIRTDVPSRAVGALHEAPAVSRRSIVPRRRIVPRPRPSHAVGALAPPAIRTDVPSRAVGALHEAPAVSRRSIVPRPRPSHAVGALAPPAVSRRRLSRPVGATDRRPRARIHAPVGAIHESPADAVQIRWAHVLRPYGIVRQILCLSSCAACTLCPKPQYRRAKFRPIPDRPVTGLFAFIRFFSRRKIPGSSGSCGFGCRQRSSLSL